MERNLYTFCRTVIENTMFFFYKSGSKEKSQYGNDALLEFDEEVNNRGRMNEFSHHGRSRIQGQISQLNRHQLEGQKLFSHVMQNRWPFGGTAR